MAQRMHGGAALQHIPLATPGFAGLNTEQVTSLLGPEWATQLTNAVIDDSNRLAARKGWADQTTTPNADALISGFEYYQHDGTLELLFATDNATCVRSTDEGVSFADVTGTAVFTSGKWEWMNFADSAVAVQSGKAPIVYSGTSFAPIADVNVPTGGVGTSFGGRLWIVDADQHTLKYCALLDETDWTGADSGSMDFQNVWRGTDVIQGVIGHNGALVVFGKDNIIVLTDGTGSALGIDPTQAYVTDIISGVGLIDQNTLQAVDGDLWFLSNSGLMSLGRLIQERSNPMDNLSKNVRSALIEDINAQGFDVTDLRSAYSPRNRFYLLSLPQANGTAEVGKTWVFDTRQPMQDGSVRCMGNWDGLIPTILVVRQNDDVLASNRANEGELFTYSSQTDDLASYGFVYRSGWTDLGAPGIIKILKRFAGIFYSDTATTVNFKWAWDFASTYTTRSKSFVSAGGTSAWGEAEWGIEEWSGGVSLREGKVVPGGTGEYIKWGIDVTISGQDFSIQLLELYAKLGRLG